MAATAHVLDLISALLEKSSSSEGSSKLRVVPVVVQELSAHRELIDAAVRDAGGVFLDSQDFVSGVEGTIDESLRRAIVTSLDVPRAGGQRFSLSLEQTGQNEVRAAINAGGTDEMSSPGLRTILGVATSLFHRDLETTSLAVLTYNESSLEEDLANAVWRLFTEGLRNVRVAGLSTLVVIIEAAAIKYERHCTAGASLEYSLGQNGLEHRKDHTTNQAMIARLRNQDAPFMVIFLAAGFSASSGWPLGDSIRDEALRNMFDSAEPYDQLIGAFYDYVLTEERLLPQERGISREEFARSPFTLERILREEMHHYGADKSPTLNRLEDLNSKALTSPGRAVESLSEILSQDRKVVLVTVNFDTLVEASNDVQVFVDDNEFAQCPNDIEKYLGDGGPVPLLKLHGTIDRRDTIIATVDETSLGLSEPKSVALRSLLRHANPLPWVYVGYSMRDPDVTSFIQQREFGEKLYENWVSPFPVDTAKRFAEQWRRELWRRSDTADRFWERSITMTADVFFEELRRAW